MFLDLKRISDLITSNKVLYTFANLDFCLMLGVVDFKLVDLIAEGSLQICSNTFIVDRHFLIAFDVEYS